MRGSRLRIIVPMALLLLAGGYFTIILLRRISPEPAWKRHLAGLKEAQFNPAWQSSIEHQMKRAWLRNEIEKLNRWTASEAAALIAAVEAVPVDQPLLADDAPKEKIEAYLLSYHALGAITERFRIGAPIDDDAREMLLRLLLNRSVSANSFVRFALANTLCASGLILTDRRVHDRVVGLIDDPDPEVAMNARRHYTWHTATPEAQEKLRKIGATRWLPEKERAKKGGGG